MTAELERAERRLAQAMTPEMQDAAGEGWPELVKGRRQERDRAAEALGYARAEHEESMAIPEVETLRAMWGSLTPPERRELLATALRCAGSTPRG